MKKLIQLSAILSWFNLVVSGLFMALALLAGSFMVGFGNVLVIVVLMGSITLHSYAALQLRKSLLYPSIPLGKQTGTGIRFMGYIALFLAFMYGSSAFYMLQHNKEFIEQVQMPAEYKNLDLSGTFKKTGIFILIFSLSVLINVILNFRLYRLYQIFFTQKDVSDKEED
jgi:hypothetical protein